MDVSAWAPAVLAELARETVRPVLLFRMETAVDVVRAWSGIGPFVIPPDLMETAAATYSGVGELNDFPAFQQLINGVAERLEINLSGVTSKVLALATEEAGVVNGAPVALGFCILGGDLQLLSPVAWLWEGVADLLTPIRQETTRTLQLSIGSIMIGRKRPSLNYWTDAQQRLRSADDAFCANVAGYTEQTTKRFKPRD